MVQFYLIHRQFWYHSKWCFHCLLCLFRLYLLCMSIKTNLDHPWTHIYLYQVIWDGTSVLRSFGIEAKLGNPIYWMLARKFRLVLSYLYKMFCIEMSAQISLNYSILNVFFLDCFHIIFYFFWSCFYFFFFFGTSNEKSWRMAVCLGMYVLFNSGYLFYSL